MRIVNTSWPTRATYQAESFWIGNTVRKLRIKEEYSDQSTRLQKIIPLTEGDAQWKENFLSYMEEGIV